MYRLYNPVPARDSQYKTEVHIQKHTSNLFNSMEAKLATKTASCTVKHTVHILNAQPINLLTILTCDSHSTFKVLRAK
jgi:hypothetical protein